MSYEFANKLSLIDIALVPPMSTFGTDLVSSRNNGHAIEEKMDSNLLGISILVENQQLAKALEMQRADLNKPDAMN